MPIRLPLAALLSLLCTGCGLGRGTQEVRLPEGGAVYFKRESNGYNYDQLGITSNADICTRLDSRTDYIFPEIGPLVVFVKVEPKKLTVFSSSAMTKPPRRTGYPIIENIVLYPSAFAELSRTYRSRAFVKIDIKTTESHVCFNDY